VARLHADTPPLRRPLAGLALGLSVTVFAVALSACGSSSAPAAAGAAGASGAITSATRTGGTSTGATSTGGSATSGSRHAALTVSPTTGDQYTVFRFGFTAPDASGRQGTTESSYTLSITGPHGAGCTAVASATLPPVSQGEPVSATMGPGTGDRWCAGTYTARADEEARPICTAGEMCPQFIRIVAAVGPVTFQIKY